MSGRLQFLFFLFCGFCIFIAIAGTVGAQLVVPSFEEITRRTLSSDRIIYDRHGRVLHVTRVDKTKRRIPWVTIDDFAGPLLTSVIVSEDQRFWSHPGVDPIAVARALQSMVLNIGTRQGASTITMQLTDLIRPEVLNRGERIRKGSITGKVRQLWMAILLEFRWTKRQILEAYLNLIHLRGEHQGIPTFSKAYLNKDPIGLNSLESSVIASMISSPNARAETLYIRSCLLVKRLRAVDDCPKGLRDIVRRSTTLQGPFRLQLPKDARHLAEVLINQFPRQNVFRTTIDTRLQKRVTEILNRKIQQLSTKNVNDAAAIVIENSSGQVLSYVGSTERTSASKAVNGVLAYRQAGSTLKPFLYGRAIDKGLVTSVSVLKDDPTSITWSGGVYRPTNYDKSYNGPVTVREALGSSLNIPAIKMVLISGLQQTYKLIGQLGFRKIKSMDSYGVSMALGSVDVQLETLTNAYRMLASGGQLTPLRYLLDERDGLLEQPALKVLSPQASYIIADILSDPLARTIGFGFGSSLETPFWSAVKTGTSKDYRDNWCIGFSDKYTVGVWAGNFDASAMEDVSGVSGAGPSWREIMAYLHKDRTSHEPTEPPGLVRKKVRLPWWNSPRDEFFMAAFTPTEKELKLGESQRVRFVFPSDGSILYKDPHLPKSHVALYLRFSGKPPEDSTIWVNKKKMGSAVSPFSLSDPKRGQYQVEIRDKVNDIVEKIKFQVR